MNHASSGTSQGLGNSFRCHPAASEITWNKHVGVGSWRELDWECWLVQSYFQCSINLMLMEGFSVLLKWLERPPYFACSSKTNPNYSYLRLSLGQSYKFIPTHRLSYNGHVSQSQSQAMTPTTVTGSNFPSSCSNFLSLILNFGPRLWEVSVVFPEATLFKVLFIGKKSSSCKCTLVKNFTSSSTNTICAQELQAAFRCKTSKNTKASEDPKHISITEDLLISGCCTRQSIFFVGDWDSLSNSEISPLLVKMGKIFYDSEIFFAIICQGKHQVKSREKKSVFLSGWVSKASDNSIEISLCKNSHFFSLLSFSFNEHITSVITGYTKFKSLFIS